MAHKRHRAKGRLERGTFLALPHSVLNSAEFAALSPRAVKLLIDLASQFRGANNGDLCAAWTLMAKRGWRSRDTFGKALAELEAACWIVRTRQGGRHRATLYALTWLGVDECGGKLDERSNPIALNTWRKTETVTRPPELVARTPCQSEATVP